MNILVLRLSAIGDIIMASGILPCIKKAYPNSKIVWVVEKEYMVLLKNSPYVDKIIPIDRKKISSLFKGGNFWNLFNYLFSTIKELREHYFDLVLDLQGILKSGIWALISRGKDKIVIEPKEGVGFFFSKKLFSEKHNKEIGAEYKMVLKHLGVLCDSYKLGVGISYPPVNLKGKYVVLSPFTTREQKFWIDEYWRKVSNYLITKGYQVVVVGGPSDRKKFNEIFPPSDNIFDLVGKLKIDEALGVISGATVHIGVDTGLTHSAMLMKVPTIAIFGSTCPYLNPGYEKGVVLYREISCSPCKRKPTCGGDFRCMKTIYPDEVISILDRWI